MLLLLALRCPKPSRFVDGLFSDCVLSRIACIRLDFGPSLRFIWLVCFPEILELRVSECQKSAGFAKARAHSYLPHIGRAEIQSSCLLSYLIPVEDCGLR